jgi:hypothetical protein
MANSRIDFIPVSTVVLAIVEIVVLVLKGYLVSHVVWIYFCLDLI